ncbi:hypothetical protein XENOCAPTIV_003575 [Xenoophorus captivus]|uniref:Uncharacterized protein n=1 Tax=Xenoophorus captivus TaxID=1517983 RepID=A0ABV0RSM6_9TELE
MQLKFDPERRKDGIEERMSVAHVFSFFPSSFADLKAADKHCFLSASGGTDILDPLTGFGGLELKSLNELYINCPTTRRCTCLLKNELWMDITPLTSEHQRGTDNHGWDQIQRLLWVEA